MTQNYSPYKQQLIEGVVTSQRGRRVYIGPTDPISDLPVVIDYEHHQLHEGETHQYTYAPAALSSGSSVLFRIVVANVTGTTQTPHFIFAVDATAETWSYIYESPTVTGNGTQQTALNRNRNSANTPTTTIWLNPTVSANGTLMSSWILGSGTLAGGQTRDALEWDLKTNTTYLIVVTAKAASDDICIRLVWYEDLGT